MALKLTRLLRISNTNGSCPKFKSNKSKNEKSSPRSKRYTDSLNLPQTSFPLSMKNGSAAQRELEIQKTSGFMSLYQWQREQNWDQEFILHDGPPYANGTTHIGHAVNKVLKDITNRYKLLKRYKVHYVPGWDCHGMPIEAKAITDSSGNYLHLPPLEIRQKAKKFAESALDEQKTSFLRWGVLADWDNVYKTLAPDYQAKQLKVFYDIYEKGFIYRDYMPVYWSPSSQSALAEAELEYKPEHVSMAVFVRFPVVSMSHRLKQLLDSSGQVYAVIWTTTPWTLPFNKAICYNSHLKYAFVLDSKSGDVYVCEAAFVDRLRTLLPGEAEVLTVESGSILDGVRYTHPLTSEKLKFLPSDHVLPEKGTGLVHTAPAHGHDDFRIAIQHNLSKECHIDEKGTYISGVDKSLLGKTVGVDANDAVLSSLGDHVMHREAYNHIYPYDWRTKQPVIIRASKQWFIDVAALRPLALESLQSVKITPPQSEKGMLAELNSRPYWCISRQRTWGVPMPVFYHRETGEPLITRETVEHVCSLIVKHGADCWWSLPVEDLLPDSLLTELQKGKNQDYEKGEDILDVWFDSGVSWASVLADCGSQADVYLEGIDQFKGWFQTSLLTSVAVNGKAPYRQIITHGFATDEEGKKMSKSLGNVVDPEVVIKGGKDKVADPSYGVDVMRWWVTHTHHHQQLMVGPSVLQLVQEEVFKLRKCVRYMLGNLYDFDPATDLVEYDQLTAMDCYLLHVLYTVMEEAENAYETIHYHRVAHVLQKFVHADLSSFYISNTRDRCYCDLASDKGRRSSQTVQYHVTRCLTSVVAPIAPHLAEEIHKHMPGGESRTHDTDSVFKLGWYPPHPVWNNPKTAQDFGPVLDIRTSLLDQLGLESPVDFDIHIWSSPPLQRLLHRIQPEESSSSSSLCEIFQTSRVVILEHPPVVIPEDTMLVQGSTVLHAHDSPDSREEVDYKILVSSALLNICERCRRYTAKTYGTPCDRCLNALAHDWTT